MNGISHQQAIQLIHQRLDGMLHEDQQSLLDEHIDSCESCRAYASEMELLPDRLQHEFHARWDQNEGPLQNMMERIEKQNQKVIMTNRISFGFKAVASVVVIMLAGLLINTVVSQMSDQVVTLTETSNDSELVSSQPDGRLLAFTSDKDGNSEIYTVNADGSGMTNLTNDPALDATPFWSPDGRKIAFTSDRDGSNQIYLMDADGSNVTRLTTLDADYGLDVNGFSPWSPDGTRLIVFKAAGEGGLKIYILDVSEKTITELTNDAGHYLMTSWSPDGNYIAFVADTGRIPRDIFTVDSNGSDLKKLTKDLPPGEYFMHWYRWSPDGSALFFHTNQNQQSYQNATYVSTIYKASMAGSIEVAATSTDLQILQWSDDMRVRLERGESLFKWVVTDGSESTLKFCENNVDTMGITGKQSNTGNWLVGANCSPNGWRLYWTNADGTIVEPLLESVIPVEEDILFNATWSFDDQYLAFVTFNSTSADIAETLYVLDVAQARQNPSAQSLKIPNASSPAWQPVTNREVVSENPTPEPSETSSSDRLIAFTSSQNGNLDIYTMNADGSGLTNITNDSANDYSPIWSPDGHRILFISERTGNPDIFSTDLDGSHLTQLTDNPGYDGSFSLSPNGEKIIYLSSLNNDANIANLMIMNADGANKIKLTDPGSYIFRGWSPNGEKIAYLEQVSERPQDDKIHVSTIEGNSHYQWTAIIDEIHWEDEGHFVGHGWSGQSEPPTWNIYRFSTDGTPPMKIASHSSPIVALNDHTYVIEGSTSLDWYGVYVNSTPMKSWDIRGTCKQGGDLFLQETSNTISPDGKRVFITAYCHEGYLQFYLANADGSELKKLTDFSVETHVNERGTWSPDGKYILTPITNKDGVTADFYLFDIEKMVQAPSIQPIQITTDGNTKYGIAWQPLANDGIVEETAIPEPTRVPVSQNFPTISTNISNGEWIAFIGGKTIPDPVNPAAMTTEQDVFLIHPDRSGLVNITDSPASYFSLQWSPDGNDLLFLRSSDSVDILRKTEPAGFDVLVSTQMSFDVPFEYSWSPNSEQIAFVDHRTGNYDIYTVYADGRNDPELAQLTNDPAQDVGFAWSPDGSQIAFQRLNGDQLSVYVMKEDGSDQHEVARGMGKVTLYWSHDGTAIYTSGTRGNWIECEGCVHEPGIYRIDLESPSVQQIYYEAESNQVGWYLYDTPQKTRYTSCVLNLNRSWNSGEPGSMQMAILCNRWTSSTHIKHVKPQMATF